MRVKVSIRLKILISLQRRQKSYKLKTMMMKIKKKLKLLFNQSSLQLFKMKPLLPSRNFLIYWIKRKSFKSKQKKKSKLKKKKLQNKFFKKVIQLIMNKQMEQMLLQRFLNLHNQLFQKAKLVKRQKLLLIMLSQLQINLLKFNKVKKTRD